MCISIHTGQTFCQDTGLPSHQLLNIIFTLVHFDYSQEQNGALQKIKLI